MIRDVLCGAVLLSLALLLGCGKPDTGRNDLPVNASQAVDKKGKAAKSFEAGIEDPAAKKK